jgi:hypothetical protein
VTGTGQGLNFGSGARAYVFNTVVTGTGGAGILAIQTGGGTGGDVSVDHCVISNNSIGFNAASANMVIRVSNTTAMNNATLFSTGGGGQVLSYGNNQAGGSAIGSPVTPG